MKKSKNILIIWKWEAWIQLENILDHKWFNLVWFLDDNSKDDNNIGTISDLDIVLNDNQVDEIYFAIPSLENREILRYVKNIVNKYNKKLLIIPSLTDIIDWDVNIDFIRPVSIEDLLFRPVRKYNIDKIKEFIKGKNVLITGAAWTIGSELVKQCITYWANVVVWLDHSEIWIFNLIRKYDKQENSFFYIKTIKDKIGLNQIFKIHNIDLVFNAAAYKHVFQMELNPDEAINNNVFWLKNIIEVSLENGVKDFCQISTDKAVNPTNLMWASKRLWELLVHYYSEIQSNMNLVAVRFGNVLWSSWSVLEIFKEQIAKWGPLTVTDKDIIRYFMSIEEAVNLVITSTTLWKKWVIFVLDMWDPIKIYDLAKKYIELSNVKWIDIQIIWLKPWEKLYEELILDKKTDLRTSIDKIFITDDKWNYKNILKEIEGLKWLYNKQEIIQKVKKIVPEFNHLNR